MSALPRQRAIGGSGGLFSPQPTYTPAPQPTAPTESPNTLQSLAIAEILAVIGEGPIVSPADLLQAIYLNGVPIKSSDGTINFANVTASISLGYPDQAFVPGISAAETLVAVATKVVAATPVVRAISDVTATAGRVSVQIPALVFQDSGGNRGPTAVVHKIEVQPNGGSYSIVATDTIFGKCVSPVVLDYDFPLSGSGPWNVRVTRLTADSNSSDLLNDLYWHSLSTIREYRLAYPNTAILRIRIDASQFGGNFPTIEYQGKLLTLQIPSNYDPVARTYSGIWDGTFTTSWTDNPAWVLWNVVINPRWGLGRWITSSFVDKWLLYDMSQWFDGLVSNGKGGTEPRFRFNGVIDSAAKAYDAVVHIAGACQAMAYWSSGAANFFVDKPENPVKQVGPANAIGGKFAYQGTDIATRPTAVYVTWRDPASGYQPAVECVEFPDKRDTYGLRVKEVAAMLCTSQGQAHRAGLYELETAWSETQILTYGVGEDQQDVMPGDVVAVADPIVQGRRTFGRILSVSGAVVTLDSTVMLDSGQTYTLRVVRPDGSLEEKSIVSPVGETSSLTLASALSITPVSGAVWQLNSNAVAARPFRVLAVDDNDDGSYAINLVQHDANKQARIESGAILHLPGFTAYPGGPIAAPSDLSISDAIELLPSGTWRHRTTLGWSKSVDPRAARYEVSYKAFADADWTRAGFSGGTTAEIDELGTGTYLFRVRVIGFDGQPSPWSISHSEALIGLDAAPPDVEDFDVRSLDASATLMWSPVVVANLSHYEVRFSSDTSNVTWQAMVPAAQRIVGTSVQVPALSGVYAIKAFTMQGRESVDPALVVTNVAGLTTNIVETLSATHLTSYFGAFDGVVLDAQRRLQLAPDPPDFFSVSDFFSFPFNDLLGYLGVTSGTFTFAQTIDLGAVYSTRVSADLVVEGVRRTDDIWNQPDVWALGNVWGSNPSGWDAWVEIRSTEDNPNASPTWSDWRRLVAGDVYARAFQARFRLTTTDIFVTPAMEGTVTFDMPDTDRRGANISVAAAGTVINFDTPFFGPTRPSVVISSLGGGSSGDYPDVLNVSKNGFMIFIRNAGGAAQSGRFIDFHAKGYG